MDRVYHRYELWECWQDGFFDTPGKEKEQLIDKVIEMFSSKKLTRKYMKIVLNKWPYSSEQHLSNEAMNRIAWLGQAACCIYARVPCEVTRVAWGKLPKEKQDQADDIAREVIKIFETVNYNNPCLKFPWK